MSSRVSDRRNYGLHLNCNDDAPYPSEVTRRPNTQHEEKEKEELVVLRGDNATGETFGGSVLGVLAGVISEGDGLTGDERRFADAARDHHFGGFGGDS